MITEQMSSQFQNCVRCKSKLSPIPYCKLDYIFIWIMNVKLPLLKTEWVRALPR